MAQQTFEKPVIHVRTYCGGDAKGLARHRLKVLVVVSRFGSETRRDTGGPLCTETSTGCGTGNNLVYSSACRVFGGGPPPTVWCGQVQRVGRRLDRQAETVDGANRVRKRGFFCTEELARRLK